MEAHLPLAPAGVITANRHAKKPLSNNGKPDFNKTMRHKPDNGDDDDETIGHQSVVSHQKRGPRRVSKGRVKVSSNRERKKRVKLNVLVEEVRDGAGGSSSGLGSVRDTEEQKRENEEKNHGVIRDRLVFIGLVMLRVGCFVMDVMQLVSFS